MLCVVGKRAGINTVGIWRTSTGSSRRRNHAGLSLRLISSKRSSWLSARFSEISCTLPITSAGKPKSRSNTSLVNGPPFDISNTASARFRCPTFTSAIISRKNHSSLMRMKSLLDSKLAFTVASTGSRYNSYSSSGFFRSASLVSALISISFRRCWPRKFAANSRRLPLAVSTVMTSKLLRSGLCPARISTTRPFAKFNTGKTTASSS